MHVSITISQSCERKQYYRQTAKSAEARISLYLLQPRMNTPKRKGGGGGGGE